jgi:hypothetical protein
LVTILE